MSDTASGSVVITHDVGLHARPSVKLTKLAKGFSSRIEVAGAPGPHRHHVAQLQVLIEDRHGELVGVEDDPELKRRPGGVEPRAEAPEGAQREGVLGDLVGQDVPRGMAGVFRAGLRLD